MSAVLSDITQGRRVGSVRAGGVVVHDVTYARGLWMSAHAHARANVTLVLGGGFVEESEDGAYAARALGVVLKRSGVQHATSIGGSGMRTVVVELDESDERRLWGVLGTGRGCVSIECAEVGRAAARVWAASRLPPSARGDGVQRGLDELARCARAALARRGPGDRAARLRESLERGLAVGVGASALAERFGLHPVSVTRIFRRELGGGVMDAVRAARVREAAERLAMSDLSLSRVACACGFADQSHMGRQFRRETGLTPGAYRSLARA